MFLKNKNIIFKIRRSKVTEYAALREGSCFVMIEMDLKFNKIVYFFLLIEIFYIPELLLDYSKPCLKRPLKKKTKNWFSRPIIA